MANQIADAIEEALEPRGIGVVAEGVHPRMVAPGIEKAALNNDNFRDAHSV